MSSFAEHKKAAVLSYINLVLTIVLGVFTTPFIIKMLGDAQYGLYTLVGAFIGYLSVMDLGLNSAVVRYVALYRARNDQKGEANFLAICFIIYFAICILVFLTGAGFYLNIDSLFGATLTPQELSQAKTMAIILIVNLAITIPGGVFAGICSGYEKFVFPRVLTIAKHLVRVVLLIVILFMGNNALGIVILDSILNVLYIAFTGRYVLFKLKVSIKLYEYKFSYVKEIFSYSVWLFLYTLIYQLQWQTGQIILGINSGTVIVGVYGIGVMLGIYYTSFGNIINGLLIPKAVQSVHKGLSNSEITGQMIKLGRLMMVLLLYVLGGFLLTGRDFIHLWIGETYKNVWFIAVLIMFIHILSIAQGYAHAILEAKRKLPFKTVSFLIFCFLGIGLGWILSFRYADTGMIVGIFSSLTVYQIIMNFYYHKKIGLNIPRFFRKSVFPFVIPFLLVVAVYLFVNKYYNSISWSSFIIKCIIYSILYTTAMFFVIKKEEIKAVI